MFRLKTVAAEMRAEAVFTRQRGRCNVLRRLDHVFEAAVSASLASAAILSSALRSACFNTDDADMLGHDLAQMLEARLVGIFRPGIEADRIF